jgi:hypothetical protein
MMYVVACSATLLGGSRIAGAVGQPAPGAVSAQTVKLPDGPGSVRGLANDAKVSSFTGQVSYEIPVDLPSGPGGLAPKLALSYSGALGNRPHGLGCSHGQVAVRRSLRPRFPNYTAADELELIGLDGPTLVPIGDGKYRAEGQGNSLRGVAVDGGFELVDAAGTRYRLGTSDASRLASGTQVAAWYLERVTDVAGHSIDYAYERNAGELYLTAITWGGTNIFRAELVYQDRPDVVVSWRTGFKIATARRLTSIRLLSFTALRRTVELTYDDSFALSRLATARVVGSDGTPSPTTTLSYAASTLLSPMRMTEPLPNCFSICPRAAESARFLFSSMALSCVWESVGSDVIGARSRGLRRVGMGPLFSTGGGGGIGRSRDALSENPLRAFIGSGAPGRSRGPRSRSPAPAARRSARSPDCAAAGGCVPG